MIAQRSAAAPSARALPLRASARRATVARAAEDNSKPSTSGSTIFYAGKAYTEEEVSVTYQSLRCTHTTRHWGPHPPQECFPTTPITLLLAIMLHSRYFLVGGRIAAQLPVRPLRQFVMN